MDFNKISYKPQLFCQRLITHEIGHDARKTPTMPDALDAAAAVSLVVVNTIALTLLVW